MADETTTGTAGGTTGTTTPAMPSTEAFPAAEPLKAGATDVADTEPPADEGDDSAAGDPASGATGEEPRRSAAQTLRDEADRLTGEARERIRTFAGDGKARATTALDDLSRMFENAAGEVDSRLGENYGQYARSAAQGIAGFADSLRGKEVDDLLDDAAAFVRKSPMIAIGTAAAVGFVLARLIKSGVDAVSDAGETDGPATS